MKTTNITSNWGECGKSQASDGTHQMRVGWIKRARNELIERLKVRRRVGQSRQTTLQITIDFDILRAAIAAAAIGRVKESDHEQVGIDLALNQLLCKYQ